MQNEIKPNKLTTKTITVVAMLGALSAILMILEFKIPLAPTFVAMDFSDVPIMLGGFLLGPLAGVLIVSLKIFLNLILNGTSTMFVGELANFILSVAFVLPAALIYKREKTKKSAIKGLIISTIFTSILAIVMNVFFIFPLYASLFGLTMDNIVEMAKVANPLVSDLTTMLIFSLLPFNLFKYGVVSLIVMVSYKKLSHLFSKYSK